MPAWWSSAFSGHAQGSLGVEHLHPWESHCSSVDDFRSHGMGPLCIAPLQKQLYSAYTTLGRGIVSLKGHWAMWVMWSLPLLTPQEGMLHFGGKSCTILIMHGHKPGYSFPLNIGESRLCAIWAVYWSVVIGAKVQQAWDSPERRGKGPSIFSILHQPHSGPLACPVQYSFVVSSQKRSCSLLWLQGQSLHVLSSLSLCLLKVLAGMGVTVTTALRKQNTFSFSPISGKPISRSPAAGYLGKIRGNRVVFKQSRSSLYLSSSVVPCGVWHVPFNVFKTWGRRESILVTGFGGWDCLW